ncbi:type III-B CRISPR-associated protein Cas10/Cmr2 [Spirulina sp. CS-785/01]|uniref:type III-B CRISPR-associated protein Cas10/Cmr2 n=1 Tax=Spirulina sp. CS-785/01 TaxID=3021716 RepID=UPI00232F65D4|nr:type III-B CRISPR-associated protein Cas10/Cmr2 [Spirulina sp. CS-785/01]MDB9315013.1 type III-B CRISPR-associated protein Cas10/Cmr2 [Spirulina sp. CS-785/01]
MWLNQQQKAYSTSPLPPDSPPFAIHPVSGEWQESPALTSQYSWGGGASQAAFQDLPPLDDTLTQLGVLTFGPVQQFLGGGQKLRDWAVASWLCHYLTAVVIHQWQQQGGFVLLPRHRPTPLSRWLQGETLPASESDLFWQPELPNIITGLHPCKEGWLAEIEAQLQAEWSRFVECLETATLAYDRHKHQRRLLDGVGWKVIKDNNRYLWSVYGETAPFDPDTLSDTSRHLHQKLESDKLSRNWRGRWWAGRTSPSAGSLSIWHPGLRPMDDRGKWGIPRAALEEWWGRTVQEKGLEGLFSESDRLNSIELVKRLASVPEIIEPTLEHLWQQTPPPCPWGRFPDRTAIAAAWVTQHPHLQPPWNDQIEQWHRQHLHERPRTKWGIPACDDLNPPFYHPRVLERRSIDDPEQQKHWDATVGQAPWESAIEWTVGWRGDGDHIGQWLSGEQYIQQNLPWAQWHPDPEKIAQYNLNHPPPTLDPNTPRQLDLPHLLDLSVLFSQWNSLLYPLVETHHCGKVIFAGGDDFLLLGPLTELTPLTSDLYNLWRGQTTPLTQPLSDGWVNHQGQTYPVPGHKMDFSLGIVIAQRRVPQSLLHRGLTQAYKTAKDQGRNRVCVQVLFNSGQSLQWVCPWDLWQLLMDCTPQPSEQTDLNRWEKLLSYFDSTRLQETPIFTVQDLITTLWEGVGLPLNWERDIEPWTYDHEDILKDWQWWVNWLSLRTFLSRQQQAREQLTVISNQ